MQVVVPIIIVIIIATQAFFFVKNLRRMSQFRNIFKNTTSWSLKRNNQTDFVNGVEGEGNAIFSSIIDSINKYLGNNSGSVIDFGLLKDAVDRHCDSVENDISTQTPIPLYLGLAGTMAGVIIGLWDLLDSNAIMTLMGSGAGNIDASSKAAATGIDALLSGVAWAMVASICGILLTTISSILFKKCKLTEESGKNSFLAWMQSRLLPELPTDTSDALNNLVRNLNKFNDTFSSNTSNLRDALTMVNESYAIQGEIIKAVHDMDVMKMAKANVRVLEELQNSTDKLEEFNQYLLDIKGYTDEIHRFERLFQNNAGRYDVLEEIRDFFRRHKGEIARTTADADVMLQKALGNIKDSTQENITEMHNRFVEQSQTFKSILNQEKEEFEEFMRKMNAQFSAQINQMPTLHKQLQEISSIPDRLDKLMDKIEKSNAKMVSQIASSMKEMQNHQRYNNSLAGDGGGSDSGSSTPVWMKLTGWLAIVIIAITCVFNMIVGMRNNSSVAVEPAVEVVEESVVKDSVATDTVISTPIADSTAPQTQTTVLPANQ